MRWELLPFSKNTHDYPNTILWMTVSFPHVQIYYLDIRSEYFLGEGIKIHFC